MNQHGSFLDGQAVIMNERVICDGWTGDSQEHGVNETRVSLNFKAEEVVGVIPFKADSTIFSSEDTGACNQLCDSVSEG